ncbi:MAG: hypothetical protein R3F51_19275 [Cyanobacteriota/Melainabacteria group bacterium]
MFSREVKNFMSNYMQHVDTGYPRHSGEIQSFCPGLIAADPKTPPAVLELFLISSDTGIIEKAAGNPSLPSDALTELSQHYDPAVKEAVIDNPCTPKEVLMALTSDPDADIRYYLAESHIVDEDVILVLCDDENPYVAARANQTWCRVSQEMHRSLTKKKEKEEMPL